MRAVICRAGDVKFQAKPTNYRFIDRTGKKYSRLLVLGYAGKRSRNPAWWCQCECGNCVNVLGVHLVQGATKSCGCLNSEINTRHGFNDTPEYQACVSARQRCENKNCLGYSAYGGRGIEFRFESLAVAVNYVMKSLGPRPTPRHSIDRIDVNSHYEPSNIRWASPKEQAQNRRDNREVLKMNEYGEVVARFPTVTAAAESVGMHRSSMQHVCKNERVAKDFRWKFSIDIGAQVQATVKSW